MHRSSANCLSSAGIGACLAVWAVTALAQQPGQQPANEDAALEAATKFQAFAKEAAAAYALRANSADGRKLVLRDEPLLRWSNPLGGRKAHGDVFLWTDEGRPAAVLSLYEFTSPEGVVHEHHEFSSLATGPLVGDGPGDRDWSPQAGIKLAPLPDAPEPPPSPVRRLSQMRQMAARFSGSKITREEREKRDLRLLPQPLLRYDSKQHEVADGGLFALVEATDPEIFLVLEVRTHAGAWQWQYGLARMNSLALWASYNDQVVWESDTLPWSEVIRRTDKSYMFFTIR